MVLGFPASPQEYRAQHHLNSPNPQSHNQITTPSAQSTTHNHLLRPCLLHPSSRNRKLHKRLSKHPVNPPPIPSPLFPRQHLAKPPHFNSSNRSDPPPRRRPPHPTSWASATPLLPLLNLLPHRQPLPTTTTSGHSRLRSRIFLRILSSAIRA